MRRCVQMRLEDEYHVRLQAFCEKHGLSKADAMRFFLDFLPAENVLEAEVERWYDTVRAK